MHNEYHIEQLNHDRLKDLALLHHAVYQREVPVGFFEKKYATAYTGHEYVGYVAYTNNGEPVGYYGVVPCFLHYHGGKLLAAQSADTMTHPGYRFKGLFVELANMCYELCRQQGIRLIFGFPNQNSYHGAVNKLGWQIAGQMDCFSIPVNTIPFARMANKTAFSRKLYENYANRILKRYATTTHPDALSHNGYDGVHRDESYMLYKTYHQHHLLKLDHALCWIKLQEAFILGDLELADEKYFDETITDIKRLAAKLGLRKIQYHICQETEMHRLFAKRFEAVPTFPVLFRDLGFDQPLDRFRFSFADIDIF